MRPTLPNSTLSELGALIASRTGLHFPAERWGDLERHLTTIARDLGMADVESCARHLLSAPVHRREIAALAHQLTVGETYFFRERQSFDVLERQIFPAVIRDREEAGRGLRIWSAGCCTGEEPYSIVMLLDRMLPDLDNRNVSVLATDINSEFLRKAQVGEYGEWSFRNTPDWIREHYFRIRHGGRFRLNEHIRRRVTFSYLNLATDAYPSTSNETNALDVIFCRNVLMYFDPETAMRVADNFHRALADGGWLVVSPAETSGRLFSRFTPVEWQGTLLYRKDAAAPASHCANPIAPQYDSAVDTRHLAEGHDPPVTAPVHGDIGDSERAAYSNGVAGGASAASRVEPATAGRAARDCADHGRLAEAAKWCHKAIDADKLNPEYHYLMGVIQREQGQDDGAARSLSNAIYLDPQFVIAHYVLGNLCRSRGRPEQAQRHFDNALASLCRHPPEEAVPESGGLTSRQLRELIEHIRFNRPRCLIHP